MLRRSTLDKLQMLLLATTSIGTETVKHITLLQTNKMLRSENKIIEQNHYASMQKNGKKKETKQVGSDSKKTTGSQLP